MVDHQDDGRAVTTSSGFAAQQPPHPLDGEWYVNIQSETYGPFTGHVIKGMIADGRISPETDVLRKGSQDWTDASADRALAALFKNHLPAPLPRATAAASAGLVSAGQGATVVQVTNNLAPERPSPILIEDGPAAPKSAGTALLLSIVIVGLGQIYNGQAGKGIAMFILCIAMWFVLLGWIINIWSMVDAYQTASRMNDRYQRRLAVRGYV